MPVATIWEYTLTVCQCAVLRTTYLVAGSNFLNLDYRTRAKLLQFNRLTRARAGTVAAVASVLDREDKCTCVRTNYRKACLRAGAAMNSCTIQMDPLRKI